MGILLFRIVNQVEQLLARDWMIAKELWDRMVGLGNSVAMLRYGHPYSAWTLLIRSVPDKVDINTR